MVTSTEHVFFFQVNSLCMIFFVYMTFAGFFLNITLELFCVFRNTEYNGLKYAHFSLCCFISYSYNCFKIVFKPFIFRAVSGGGGTSEHRRREPPGGGGSGGMIPGKF